MSAKAKKERTIVIRCIAYPGSKEGKHGYYAVCIDLNLVIWRAKPRAAMESMNEAVVGYLETVAEISKQGGDWKALVPRPAPFWPYKVLYHLFALRRALPKLGPRQESYIFEGPAELPGGTPIMA